MFCIYAYPCVCVCVYVFVCLCVCVCVYLFVCMRGACAQKRATKRKRHSAKEGLYDCACRVCGCVIGYRHAMKPLETSASRRRRLVACRIQHHYRRLES